MRQSKESQLAGWQAQASANRTLSAARVSRSFLALWNRRGLVLLVLDLFCIAASFLLAYELRFYVDWLLSAIPPPIETPPPAEPYYQVAALTSAAWVFLLWKDRSYTKALHFSKSLARQVQDVLTNGFYATVFLLVFSFMFRYFFMSRLVYAIAMGLAFLGLTLARAGFDLVDRRLAREGLLCNRVLLLGWDLNAEGLAIRLKKRSPGTVIIGRIVLGMDSTAKPISDGLISSLGTVENIHEVYSRTPFDQLIVGSHRIAAAGQGAGFTDALIQAINFCESKGIPVYMVPDFLDVAVRRREVGSLDGLPFILLRDASVHPVYPLVKRAVDIVISLAVLVAGLPLWLLLALLIKLTSKGPVFYVQQRAGLHGKPFAMRKFRSMVEGAHERLGELVNFDELSEPSYHLRRDPRVTPLGRILRRTSLDEIPQFIHVLRGTMSLVGPRPEMTELVERYNSYQRRRLKAKPGITGYQQVMDHGEPSLARRIDFDLHYLKYQSLALDLYIIARTIYVLITGDGKK